MPKPKSKPAGRDGVRFSLWIPADAYKVLSVLAKNWTESRTKVLLKLIYYAEHEKLKLQVK